MGGLALVIMNCVVNYEWVCFCFLFPSSLDLSVLIIANTTQISIRMRMPFPGALERLESRCQMPDARVHHRVRRKENPEVSTRHAFDVPPDDAYFRYLFEIVLCAYALVGLPEQARGTISANVWLSAF